MSPVGRRRMTLLDAILLVGSAAISMGAFEGVRRSLFQGRIRVLERGLPDFSTWWTSDLIVTCSDLTVFLVPVVAPWTLLLIVLRLRSPRPRWRRIWGQPGMAACLAAVFGWCWSGLALILALDAGYVARPTRNNSLEAWAEKYLADEVFMYVGLAVAAAWMVQYASGRWRRSADWVDLLGRIVGALWILVGLVWTLRAYHGFV
jgi:hypothetical protein